MHGTSRVAGVERLTVYALPSCSKSRTAVSLLDERAVDYRAIDYVRQPPGAETIGRLLDGLDGAPGGLVRVDDNRFGELGLHAGDVADRDGVISVLVAHPELMQRPVVVRGDRVVVARPPELVLDLLD
jgi:arsenate reductase